MSDLRERVARAICEAELGHDLLDQMVMTRESYFDAADAAIATVFEWQPIETAPHATLVLLFSDGKQEVGYASSGERRKLSDGSIVSNMSRHGYATHWMPLPPPPPGGGK